MFHYIEKDQTPYIYLAVYMKLFEFSALQMILVSLWASFCIPIAQAANFTPNVLKISAAPSSMNYCYYYDRQLDVPVTISGTPATVFFLVFTHNYGQNIKNLRNGHLGWHYVNNIDTCIYISSPYQFEIGQHTITWNGRNNDGKILHINSGAFYIWGYDNRSMKIPATRQIDFRHGDRSFIRTMGPDQTPLDRPIIYDAPQSFSDSPDQTLKTRTKWVIGDDIDNPNLRETCSYMSWAENCPIYMDTYSPNTFYTQTLKPDGNLILRSYQWVPNGEAKLNNEWGSNGESYYKTNLLAGHAYNGGPVSDGADLLFITDGDPFGGKQSDVIMFDRFDGGFIKKVNLSEWWTDPGDGNTYGPSTTAFSNGMILCGSMGSCITMALDPYRANYEELAWVNGNGDYIGDKNYDPSSPNPWKCNDPGVPPYPVTLSGDRNGFLMFPTDGVGSTSFGVFAPDGRGVGYFPFAGDTGTTRKGIHVVDYGSAYDGIYCDNSSAGADSSGWWYVGQDSFRGSFWDNYHDFEQPGIKLISFNDGGIYHAGDVETIVWMGMANDVIRVEFSSDNGKTWNIIIDKKEENQEIGYDWKIPNVSSDLCHIRVTDLDKPAYTNMSYLPFTITGPSGISDSGNLQPENFITASCYPNPFNPYTTIRYYVPTAGKVKISIHNALGQKIRQFDRGVESRGIHEMRMDGRDLTSGVYFYRIERGAKEVTGRMLLMK
jgi:hypothetical protein